MKYYKDTEGNLYADPASTEGLEEVLSPVRADGTILPKHEAIDSLALQEDGTKYLRYLTEPVGGVYQPDVVKETQVELATKTAQAEEATFAYVQARVDTYNTTHGLCFANVYTCKSYAGEANYAHAQFCQDVFSWNTAVWEEARVIQEKIASGELTPPETVEEYLALLPEYTGAV